MELQLSLGKDGTCHTASETLNMNDVWIGSSFPLKMVLCIDRQDHAIRRFSIIYCGVMWSRYTVCGQIEYDWSLTGQHNPLNSRNAGRNSRKWPFELTFWNEAADKIYMRFSSKRKWQRPSYQFKWKFWIWYANWVFKKTLVNDPLLKIPPYIVSY